VDDVSRGDDSPVFAPHEPTLAEPFLQVVRGDAAPEEIAALVATLAAIAAARSTAAAQAKPAHVLSHWNAPARRLRAPLHPAPGAWRRSALP
jgi:acyl-CoA carboxylase epsilon subunit